MFRKDPAILFSLVVVGLACLFVDFLSLEKSQSIRLSFPEINSMQLFELKEVLAEKCERTRISQLALVYLDGIDCRNLEIAEVKELTSRHAEHFEAFFTEQTVAGTKGKVMFLFSGVWFFLSGIYLTMKTLKDE